MAKSFCKKNEGCTAQKMKFSVKDFFSKCGQIQRNSTLLRKFLVENFIFSAVMVMVHICPLKPKKKQLI